jgi:hypothetical protein
MYLVIIISKLTTKNIRLTKIGMGKLKILILDGSKLTRSLSFIIRAQIIRVQKKFDTIIADFEKSVKR